MDLYYILYFILKMCGDDGTCQTSLGADQSKISDVPSIIIKLTRKTLNTLNLCLKCDDGQEWNWTCYKSDITGHLSCISGASSPEMIAGGLQFCRKLRIHSVLLLVVSPGGPSVHIVSPGHRQAGLRAAHSEWVETSTVHLSQFVWGL